MSRILLLGAALFSALRYELARLVAAGSTRTVGLLSMLGWAALPAVRTEADV